IKIYPEPESALVLHEIQEAHARVERPLNEVTDCYNLANEKKNLNLPFWEKLKPVITRAEQNLKIAQDKWKNLSLKKEEVETFRSMISDLWRKTQEHILRAENALTEAEACMGDNLPSDGQAIVPDLTGMNMAAAKNRTVTAGFKPLFKGGNPSPSKELAFTVASQNPSAGEMLAKGSGVSIVLYGDFSGYTVPDVQGLTSKQAKENLERAGFKAALEGGDPAPSEDLKFKVQTQAPEAGEKAEQGSSVRVRIYGDVLYVLVPSVINMTSSQAKSTMSDAGLVPSLFGGDPAPKKSMSYQVQDQSPAPGSRVLYGSTADIHVYGDFNELTALANANCNNLSGSTLKWDYQNDHAICVCPSGMVINNAGNACVDDPQIQQERDRRNQFWTAVVNTAVPIIVNEITRDNTRNGSDTSGGNRSGENTSGSSTGSTSPTISSGNIPTGGTSGSSGLSRDECERKYCPECKDKGVDLLGVAVNDQCNECRKRKKSDIDKCMSGEKTGPGTSHVGKDYMVVCYWEWDNNLGTEVCRGADLVKKSPPPVKQYHVRFGPDTWDNCYKHTRPYTSNLPEDIYR
ncbi:MAG: PASTA domain-containing protein, partial [Deltaproteobacteria bacterium]|nr:PASTA domain-containing protein [Deltaproteobacteria bacterium]